MSLYDFTRIIIDTDNENLLEALLGKAEELHPDRGSLTIEDCMVEYNFFGASRHSFLEELSEEDKVLLQETVGRWSPEEQKKQDGLIRSYIKNVKKTTLDNPEEGFRMVVSLLGEWATRGIDPTIGSLVEKILKSKPEEFNIETYMKAFSLG